MKKNYEPPRLATPSPCNPGAYNREQTERRMLSKSGTAVVAPLGDQVAQSIDATIAQIKERARSRIHGIATKATTDIARLQAQKAKAR